MRSGRGLAAGIVAVCLVAAATIFYLNRNGPAPVSEVLGTYDSLPECMGSRCQSRAQVSAEVGFLTLEPRAIGELVLIERAVHEDILSPEARQAIAGGAGISLDSIPEKLPSNTASLIYAFRQSLGVPSLHVLETGLPSQPREVSLPRSDCGERVPELTNAYYVPGVPEMVPVNEELTSWTLCASRSEPNRRVESIVLIRDHVVVKASWFPESKLDRDSVTKILATIQ